MLTINKFQVVVLNTDMADNEQPTTNPNNASRIDVPPSDIHNERHDHEGTSIPAREESSRDDYLFN